MIILPGLKICLHLNVNLDNDIGVRGIQFVLTLLEWLSWDIT